MILLHYTGLRPDALEAWSRDPGGQAVDWLCNPQAEVSSHYVVQLDGRVEQLVAEAHRAWHAGRGAWLDCTDINSCSIGIEIVNTGHDGGLPTYPEVQIAAVIALCRDIATRHSIAPERVLGHSDIAPGRKVDPGEHFPWDRLHRAGVGHWVEPVELTGGRYLHLGDSGPPVEMLRNLLCAYGYDAGSGADYDAQMERCVRAFQRHFRPARVDGMADKSTMETLLNLIAALDSKSTT